MRDECVAAPECWWNALSAECITAAPLVKPQLDCRCNGSWAGSKCDVCNAPSGATCLRSGLIVACDGFTYTSAALAPSTDRCGVCRGSNQCVGCDGVPNSGLVFDQCGECGGRNSCLRPGVDRTATIPVVFLLDVTKVPNQFEDVASILLRMCVSMYAWTLQGTFNGGIKCIGDDFFSWSVTAAGLAAGGLTIDGLYTYAKATFRLTEVGLVLGPNGRPTSVQFMTVRAYMPVAGRSTFALYEVAESRARAIQRQLDVSGVQVVQTSTAWATALAERYSVRSAIFTCGCGLLCALIGTTVLFGSFRMGFFVMVAVGQVLCALLGTARLARWPLDPSLQVTLAIAVGIASESAIHVAQGFLDYLQSTQSHLFAVETTRYHALRGALVRTGVSLVTATVTIIFLSFIGLWSALVPLRQASAVLLSAQCYTLLATVCFGGVLCAFGSRHVFRSAVVSCVCLSFVVVAVGVVLLTIYLTGGIEGPVGQPLLQ